MELLDEFSWSDSFLLGFGPMDAVHQEFVGIVHVMLTCPDADLLEHLKVFERHAEVHFSQEHQWMKSTNFQAMQCHDDEHLAVQKSVSDVIPLVEQGNFSLGRALAKALADWFPGHAAYLDSALAQWMVKLRTGGVPVVIKHRILPSAVSI